MVPAMQAAAATSAERDAFASALRGAMNDSAQYDALNDALIDGMNIGPEKAPLFRRYFEEVMTDPAMQ